MADVDMGLRDYRWVSESLPGKIAPMDLDAVLEKNGHVLILEMKPKGAPVPLGQRLTLKNFVRMGCDVWVIWGDGPTVEAGEMDRNGNVNFIAKLSIAKLKNKVTGWFKEAEETE